MTEVVTNSVVLLACVMCIITLTHQLKPKFKRKPKRLFYVKLNGEYIVMVRKSLCSGELIFFWYKSKEDSIPVTDTEYDRIKHLLPNDHTLELVNDKNK